jgi:hypothetical protein
MRLLVRATTGALAVAMLVLPLAPSVRAECTMLDPWPAFEKVALSAETVVLGEVVEDHDPNSELYISRFGLRVDEVFRGSVVKGSVLDVAFLTPGRPPVHCADTYIRPLFGDVLAIAINSRGPNGESLNSAAWIKGQPDDMQRGLGSITRIELRSMFDQPATDTVEPPAQPDAASMWLIWVLAGLVGAVAFVRRRIA